MRFAVHFAALAVFAVFYVDGACCVVRKIKGTYKPLGQTDALYIDLNVLTKGYLKNGKVTFNSDNNFNVNNKFKKGADFFS